MKKYIIFGLILILLTSCYVQKPKGRVSQQDYNGRVSVSDARLVKRSTPIDISFKVGIIGAGAYGGYAAQLIKVQDGNEQKPVNWANVALGTLAGFGVTTFMDLVGGKNKESHVTNPAKWIEKSNREYMLLQQLSRDSFTVIPRNADKNFQIKNLKDAEDFAKVFSVNNLNAERVVKDASTVLVKEDLAKFITLYQSHKAIGIAESHYLELCVTTSEVLSIKGKYKTLKDDQLALKAASLVASVQDINLHHKYWKGNRYNDLLISSVLGKGKRDEIPQIIDLFPQNNTEKLQQFYIISSPDIVSFVEAVKKYPAVSPKFQRKLNVCDIANVKEYSAVLKENIDYFGSTNLERLSSSLKERYVNCAMQNVKNKSLAEMNLLAKTLNNEKWLDFPKMANYKTLLSTWIADKEQAIDKQKRVDELAKINKNDIGGLVTFCNKYPNTTEANEVAKILDGIVNKYVTQTFSEAWFAKGDRGWIDDVLESSRDLFAGGSKFNYIRLGVLKNNYQYTLKLKVQGKMDVKYNCGVSLFRTSSIDSYTDTDYIEIQPGKSYPYAFLYRNISEGTTLGRGLLSAGCAYIDHSEELNLSYYAGEISKETVKEQMDLVELLVNNGNIKTKLSGNDEMQEWTDNFLKNTLNIRSSASTVLRVYFYKNQKSDYVVTINENWKKVGEKKAVGRDSNTFDFFVTPDRTYNVVIPEYGVFTVYAKGRLTHLIVNNKGEGRIDYQDVD